VNNRSEDVLKPCPKCEHERIYWETIDFGGPRHKLYCLNCGYIKQSSFASRIKTVREWNEDYEHEHKECK
jgi:transcription elongation factor Elf1